MYKLLTAIITEVLYQHAIEIEAIPQEQWALLRGKRGCLDPSIWNNGSKKAAMG